MENFVPPAEAVKVKGRAVLNVETDEWTLTPVQASDPRSLSHTTMTVLVLSLLILYMVVGNVFQ